MKYKFIYHLYLTHYSWLFISCSIFFFFLILKFFIPLNNKNLIHYKKLNFLGEIFGKTRGRILGKALYI